MFRGPSNKDPGSTLIEVRDIQKLPSQGWQSHDEHVVRFRNIPRNPGLMMKARRLDVRSSTGASPRIEFKHLRVPTLPFASLSLVPGPEVSAGGPHHEG